MANLIGRFLIMLVFMILAVTSKTKKRAWTFYAIGAIFQLLGLIGSTLYGAATGNYGNVAIEWVIYLFLIYLFAVLIYTKTYENNEPQSAQAPIYFNEVNDVNTAYISAQTTSKCDAIPTDDFDAIFWEIQYKLGNYEIDDLFSDNAYKYLLGLKWEYKLTYEKGEISGTIDVTSYFSESNEGTEFRFIAYDFEHDIHTKSDLESIFIVENAKELHIFSLESGTPSRLIEWRKNGSQRLYKAEQREIPCEIMSIIEGAKYEEIEPDREKVNTVPIGEIKSLGERNGEQMLVMDEETFKIFMGNKPWFMPIGLQKMIDSDTPDIEPFDIGKPRSRWTSDDASQFVFGRIFGSYGVAQDLDDAIKFCLARLELLGSDIKENADLVEYERMNILLGTAYAYKQKYIEAAYHLMRGMKLHYVVLSGSYCDFIQYVFDKLNSMPKKQLTLHGVGYSADEPAGGRGGDFFCGVGHVATILSSLAGPDGELTMVYKGESRIYGSINRLGSTISSHYKHPVDIYVIPLISRDYKLFELKIYFYAYLSDSVITPTGLTSFIPGK